MPDEFPVIPTERYPKSLDDWKPSRRKLWYTGNLDLLALPMVSVVGTREPSPEGAARADRVARLAAHAGWAVVSGLAAGIDAAAHAAALRESGQTIAVLGTPIDKCYPKSNAPLKAAIEEQGLVISQFPPDTPTRPGNFPTRNTLMAAISAITIVVEAGEKSGSRHQVKAALRMGRIVGLLNSLADQPHAWILDALDSPSCVKIMSDRDLEEALTTAKRNQDAPRQPAQRDLFS